MAPRWAKRYLPKPELFAHGHTEAKHLMVAFAIVGEVLQGGLVFGWNALALMLQARNNFAGKCGDPSEQVIKEGGRIAGCKAQESSLAVLWTIGIFALNFGPVFVGPILDAIGPRWTAILGCGPTMLGLIFLGILHTAGDGCLLNTLGLVFLGVSHTRDGVNLLHPGAILIGLGGITFHLAQFHISGLYPRNRGLISSLFVAGFTGCGIIFYILQRIFEDLGSTQCAFGQAKAAYRAVLLVYGLVFCGGFIPVTWWLMPKEPFSVGEVYVFSPDSWRPVTKLRQELEVRMTSATDLPAMATDRKPLGASASQGSIEMSNPFAGNAFAGENGHTNGASLAAPVITSSLTAGGADSSDPRWSDSRAGANTGAKFQDIDLGGLSDVKVRQEDAPSNSARNGDEQPESPADPNVNPPLNTGVVWGPLVFEPRRFVELRKKPFKTQALSAESLGMGLFYTVNVFWIQFYLGTTRLQLQHKGDYDHTYTDLANILPCAGILGLPLISWLLDKKGYGITLGTINALSVLTSVLQAIPSLPLQAVTLVVWTAARFFLYASYFTIFGVLFGFKNFGKMVAIDNTVNGLIGLLQLPVSWLGINSFNGNFTAINIAQIVILLPIFVFCWMMHKWGSENLVPIRPMEGQELPENMVPPKKKGETSRRY